LNGLDRRPSTANTGHLYEDFNGVERATARALA